eukprot:1146983-Amphidinium_carterae.1
MAQPLEAGCPSFVCVPHVNTSHVECRASEGPVFDAGRLCSRRAVHFVLSYVCCRMSVGGLPLLLIPHKPARNGC